MDVNVEIFLLDNKKGWAEQEILEESIEVDGKKVSPYIKRTEDNRTAKISIGSIAARESKKIVVRQTIKVKSVYFEVKPEDVGTDFPEEVMKYTLPVQGLWESDSSEIKEFAKAIVGNEVNPYKKAKLILEKVMEYLTWEWQAEEHSALWAYYSKKGDCTEHANLLIALMRAAGIPAKAALGFGFIPLYTERASEVEEGFSLEQIGHAWAIIYLPNIGWVPMDSVWPEKIGSFAEADYRHIVSTSTGGENIVQNGEIVWPGIGILLCTWYGSTLEGSFAGAIAPEIFIEPELKESVQTPEGFVLTLNLKNLGKETLYNLEVSIDADLTYFQIIPSSYRIGSISALSQIEKDFEVKAIKSVHGKYYFIPKIMFESIYGRFLAKGIPISITAEIEVEVEAEIVGDLIFSSRTFKAGDNIEVSVNIKNTGKIRWTFYVNGTIVDSIGKLYSNDFPYESISLGPGDIGSVTLELVVGMSTPAGPYDVKVAIWKNELNSVLEGKLHSKEKSNAFSILPDGFDYDALEWVNVIEARNLIPENEEMPEILIAVIDTGIDPDVWEYIESKGGDIVLYVRPERYFDWGLKWPWEWGWKWRYVTADNPNDANVRDSAGVMERSHGSEVVSVISQIVPRAKIIVLDVAREGADGRDIAFPSIKVCGALQWIIDNIIRYDVDIVCMSSGGPRRDSDEENKIRTLHDQYGVIFIASSGNEDKEKYNYPASYDRVLSIGGIFDDDDGYLTFAMERKFNTEYSGSRVTELRYMEYRLGSGGSTYNDEIDFVAPMFDIEVLRFYTAGNQPGLNDVYPFYADGTSFSSPIVAGIVALIFHAYYKEFGREPDVNEVYEALEQTAEKHPVVQDLTPKPILNGKVYDILQKNESVGWGCIDAYDAIIYIREKAK
jgi:subtilisin family serine protease